jgi:hypothetical protein
MAKKKIYTCRSSCDFSHSPQLNSNTVFDCLSTSCNINGFEQGDGAEHLFDMNSIWVLWTVEANGPNVKRSVKQQSESTTCGIIFCPCPWSYCPPFVKWRHQAPAELR